MSDDASHPPRRYVAVFLAVILSLVTGGLYLLVMLVLEIPYLLLLYR